ncbi:hypothetical protein EGW08_001604 [Elysia chlorotica]|uniref:Uncharacterized protein n=1 Tax=Elysia chlorotica TaxID=188477 RepID=A0A433U9W9_ELYCH|nr:hypothetical protein EGW08_001604 [Elysia chlorotica]
MVHYTVSPAVRVHYTVSPAVRVHYTVSPAVTVHYTVSPAVRVHYTVSPAVRVHYTVSPAVRVHYTILPSSLNLDVETLEQSPLSIRLEQAVCLTEYQSHHHLHRPHLGRMHRVPRTGAKHAPCPPGPRGCLSLPVLTERLTETAGRVPWDVVIQLPLQLARGLAPSCGNQGVWTSPQARGEVFQPQTVGLVHLPQQHYIGYIVGGPQDGRLTILCAATHETGRKYHDSCLSWSHYTDTDPTRIRTRDLLRQKPMFYPWTTALPDWGQNPEVSSKVRNHVRSWPSKTGNVRCLHGCVYGCP